MIITRFILLIGLGLLSLSLGCGSDAAGRVAISGTVDLDGKPLDGASIAFVGGGGGALATATTDKEGSFRVKVALGINKVSISKVDPAAAAAALAQPKKEEDMLMGTPEQVKKIAQPKAGVPEKYGNPTTSGLQFDITNGMQPLSISLSSK